LGGKYLVDLPGISAIFEATENDNIIVFDIFALNGGQCVAVAETRGLAFHLRFDPFSPRSLDELDDAVSTISSCLPLFSSLGLLFSLLLCFLFFFRSSLLLSVPVWYQGGRRSDLDKTQPTSRCNLQA